MAIGLGELKKRKSAPEVQIEMKLETPDLQKANIEPQTILRPSLKPWSQRGLAKLGQSRKDIYGSNHNLDADIPELQNYRFWQADTENQPQHQQQQNLKSQLEYLPFQLKRIEKRLRKYHKRLQNLLSFFIQTKI